MIVFAAEGAHVTAAKGVLDKIEGVILFPLMSLMMSVALLMFLWGMYEYVLHADEDESRTQGKMHMLYGIIGLLIMISAYGILKIAAGTFGITDGLI
ncbi:MAG: hypothetical protein K9M10_02340 [Candidatus Pacebacteria bacterium]|nr:hypothetical protein [Candidatus Paceibacterota bacterium]MCF7857294.1 hypothetical protein [Candidatus Paceibacterota bacterium]